MFKSRFSNLIILPLHHSNYLCICSRDLFSIRFSGTLWFSLNCLNTDLSPPLAKKGEWTNVRGRTDNCNWMEEPRAKSLLLPVQCLCPVALLTGGSSEEGLTCLFLNRNYTREHLCGHIRARYLVFLGRLAGFGQHRAQGWDVFRPTSWATASRHLPRSLHQGWGCPCAGQNRLKRGPPSHGNGTLGMEGTTSHPRVSWFLNSLNCLDPSQQRCFRNQIFCA